MDKCLYKGVDIFNPLSGKMKYFIDAFTKVYGEEYRSVIEKRLKDANFYFLGGKFSTIILKYKELEREEIKELEQQKGLNPSLIKMKKQSIHERYSLIINIFEDTQKQMDIVTYKYANAVNDLLIKHFNQIRKNNGLEEFPKLQAQKYIYELQDLLTIGKNDFTKKSFLISDSRKKEFTKLFKNLGYNEKDLNGFVKNKKLLKSIFNNSIIHQINQLHQFRNDELNKINFCVADLKYHLKNLNIYKDSKSYEDIGIRYIQNKTNNAAFVVNCVTYDSKFKSLCFCKNALDLTLEDLTHEMGHIIDAFVVESNQDGFYYKSGFELHYHGFTYEGYENSIVPEIGDKNYRQSELFNEMINDYITKKVAQELKNTGKTFTFGEHNKNTKVKYEFGFEVFDDFIEKYQDKIIELKMTVDKNETAYEYFGKENLEKLILIAKEYIERRVDINKMCLNGDPKGYEILEKYKNETKAKIDAIEKKIENHILKQKEKETPKNKIEVNENEVSNNEVNESQTQETNFAKAKLKTKLKSFLNNFSKKEDENKEEIDKEKTL